MDLSPFLFFWVGYLLLKHNNAARKWIIAISFIGATVTILAAIVTAIAPFTDLQVRLMFFGEVQKTSLVTTYSVISLALIVFLIPIILLYNDKAREDFGN